MKAVRVHEFGGPEMLRYEDVPVPEVGPGEVLMVAHAGLLYMAERALGADGERLGNLDGRWVALGDEPPHANGGERRLADMARLGERINLLPEDEITIPGQI